MRDSLIFPRTVRLLRMAAVLTLAAVVFSASAPTVMAQSILPREAALEVRKQFLADLDVLHGKFLALAEAVPAYRYAWRPAAEVRSIGEAFMHVASEYYYYTPMAYGATPSPLIPKGEESFKKFESASTKADVRQHLTEGFAYTRKSLMALDVAAITGTQKLFGGERTIVETSFSMLGDLHEHLGQLIAYARSNGIKPPWSR